MEAVDVIVFGSAIVDFICYCPRLPKVGETLHGDRFSTGFGGKGANQCVAAARLGAKTAMIASLGDDQWGRDYLENLRKEGVNTDFVQLIQGETTGIAAINVSEGGDNQIVIVVGANNKLSAQGLKDAVKKFTEPKVLICQLETPVTETIEALKLFSGVSILNAAPAMKNAPQDLIRFASILCVNESEAGLMTGMEVSSVQDAKGAIKRFIELGANTVIITMGGKGAVYSEAKSRKVIHVPVESVAKVVDTTGAGDAFIGVLAYFIAKHPNMSMTQTIGAACEIASISVQHPGTQSSFPYAKNIEDRNLLSKKFAYFDL
ncbi:unnamed protein product [Hermetia illucens]|uniref:Ribokinase n=1 Tax=Hermetia illucens TaxID=343691 RepID=A0A7R8YUU0_HERIL|nr:ribokinase [Hermetia illucens]XP_037914049.1 ribokinase [Hermetia illucens]CAD7086557.1 unnamed protein product [Hermetia illucens]